MQFHRLMLRYLRCSTISWRVSNSDRCTFTRAFILVLTVPLYSASFGLEGDSTLFSSVLNYCYVPLIFFSETLSIAEVSLSDY